MNLRSDKALERLCKPDLIRAIKYLENSIDEIVVCAVRYALPAHTYITASMADFVKEHSDFISNRNLSIIYRDVTKHLEEVEGEKDSIDKPYWKGLLVYVGSELVKRGFVQDVSGHWEKQGGV